MQVAAGQSLNAKHLKTYKNEEERYAKDHDIPVVQ